MTTHAASARHGATDHAAVERCLSRSVAAADRIPTKLLWTIAGFARSTGHHEDAGALLDVIERRDGSTVKMMEERARVAFSRGDVDAALALLTERYERSPSATASIAIARLHLESGNVAEASRLSAELSVNQGDLATVKQLAADVARAEGRFELARSYYLGLIDDRFEHPSSLLALAQLSLDEGDRDSAVAFFRRGVAQAETFTANQKSLASGIAERLEEQELAVDFARAAAAAQEERTRRLIAEIEGALVDIPDTPPVSRPTADRTLSTPRVHTVAKRVAGPREHSVALHAAHGSIEPDDPRVVESLNQQFGHARLRPGQSAVIGQVLAGHDTLAIMPTGAGKSLTFQLPAMLDDKTTVVVSPLIALMKDQVETLPDSVRQRTALINSTLTQDEMRQRLDQLAQGQIKLVYVAPERLRNYGFLRALREAGVSRVVVDEAHCISMWGHDFRPDYLFIPRALTELGEPPVLGITATATPDMVEQIGSGLGRDLKVVRTSVFRSNLRYEVHHLDRKEAKLERVVQICKSERGDGIVYVSSRRDTESIANLLRDRGVFAVPYHAGLEPSVRNANQDQFMTGRARVVVATVAFGMGVNKADVRFIIHVVPPRSLEAYAQESGRAGRDGKPARCVLLVSPHDRTQLAMNARRDELDVPTLRRFYSPLKRQARGSWVIVDPSVIRPATTDEDNDPDPKVAFGILEQAGLIHRHPDAPVTYELRRLSQRLDEALDPELVGAWEKIERNLPETWNARGGCSVTTAELSTQTGLPPVEIDRVLQAHPSLSVREGQRCMCLHLNDVTGDATSTIESILDRARRDAEARINQVMSYANGQSCRHAALAAHLGERLEDCGTACDVCTGTADTAVSRSTTKAGRVSVTPQDALAVLQAVNDLPYQMGKTGLVRLLTGSIESRLRADRSEAFGVLANMAKSKVDSLIDRLIEAGFLFRDLNHEYKLISLTPRGASAGLVDLQEFDESSSNRSVAIDPELNPHESRLYERLADWRRAKAIEEAVPPYVVAHNSTLKNLAVSRPATKTALLAVPGFGSTRVEKYGSEILSVIGDSGD